MKRTNKLWLAVLLTVLVASLLAVGFTAAAEGTKEIGHILIHRSSSYGTCTWLDMHSLLVENGLYEDANLRQYENETPNSNIEKHIIIQDGEIVDRWYMYEYGSDLQEEGLPSEIQDHIEDYLVTEPSGTHWYCPELTKEQASTCCTPGYIQKQCAVCEAIERTEKPLDPNNHPNCVTVEKELPTATKPGHEAGVQCLDCGQWLSGGEVIAPLAEDWGYCGAEGDGTNLIWTLDNEGTLTISGEGAMKSFAFTSDNRIQFVIMENGVTDIGYSAFSTCASLREVSIPGSVTKIGLFAFEGCSSLKSVYIPEGVKIIDDCAFQYCWSLNSVYIPVSVEQIGWESFDLSPLKDVFCAGIRSQHNILFGENNTSLLKAKWHYNVFAGGYCGGEGDGTNLVWVLDNDGTLTVSGTGAMADYSDSAPAPWNDCFAAPGAEITVLLEAGVTYIGANAFPASDGLKELIVLNRDCDLSALVIREPAFLRGYLGSTAEDYGNAHADESLFMPLCDVDYRHAADWKVEWDDEEDPDRHIEGVYCFVCSEYIYARFDAHEWSDWETVKEPTTEAEGEETRTCSVCDKTETRSVEKLQPEGNGNNNNNNDDGGGFFGAIRRAMASIVKWFRKLLSFFSK